MEKLLTIYMRGFLNIVKLIIILILASFTLLYIVITIPFWWVKLVRNGVEWLSDIFEKVLWWCLLLEYMHGVVHLSRTTT